MNAITLLMSCVVLSFAVAGPEPAAAEKSSVDVQSYVIDAVIGESSLSETVSIRITARKKLRNLELELAPTMNVKSCRLGEKDVPYERDGYTLRLDLSGVDAPKDGFEIVIEAEGRPYLKFSENRGGFVRTNVGKDHAYIRRQYPWYPRLPDDLAEYTTSIEAREDWLVRTAGRLDEKTVEDGRCTWRYRLDRPGRRIGLVAGDYVIVEHETSSLDTLDALVAEGHEEAVVDLLDTAARALDFYSSLFGPIAMERFTLVEMPAAYGTGSGYGQTGYILIGTGAFEEPWGKALVAHEVAHSWWGEEVAFENFAGEMFATYATNRFLEECIDPAAARDERLRYVDNVIATAPKGEVALSDIRSSGGGMNPAVYRAHAYDKASMILRTLELEMGRKSFDATVKKFFNKHRGELIDYEAVKKSLGGSRYKYVFDQWGNPGIPQVGVEYEFKKKGSRFAVSGKLVQDGTDKPFRMTVPLAAAAGDRTHEHEIQVKKAETAFKFDCPFEPERILIDPGCDLIVERIEIGDEAAMLERVTDVCHNPKMGDEKVLRRTISDLERLLGRESESEGLYYTYLGRCRFRLDERDEAREAFKKALNLGAGGPFHRGWIHLRLGCMHDLDGDRSKAESCYKEVLNSSRSSDYTKQLAQRFLQKPYRGYTQDR